MAYGDRGAGAQIPGGATLKFAVELIDFVGKQGNKPKLSFKVETIKEGSGPTVPKGVSAKVHYTGKL